MNNPTKGRIYGSSVAAPVFKEIADKIVATQLENQMKAPNQITKAVLPERIKGEIADFKTLYQKLDYPVSTKTENNWSVSQPKNAQLELSKIDVREGIIPNVSGMGVRDAVFLLESLGVETRIIGRGRVSSQSVRAGTRITKGMKIVLNLSS